ncbi:hypothetical protein DWF00_22970 [Bosea caraganae]|uniref:Lipoprotein n=1 Tax=Bosea caraganae TaxID=2763117 RepID=A0A370L1P4_9HYPH|nr:hypothetical protein [Bosea caraganae]RDJ21515.1 hypothetical protein DWE98_21035 [Bosea caraganae]RDJ23483.1 hypothetical protein DWF00_22970 [Bosea caraganae]
MPCLFGARTAALACLLALPLGACVSSSNPSAGRAAEFANLVSRSTACRAGNPRANTLEQFLATERTRGATAEQLASARSTYITVSEADTINQGVKPQACTADERVELKARMAKVRAGNFDF